MEAKVNYAIVGAFVLLLGTALVAGVLWLSSGGAYRKAYDTYRAYMQESVSGLSLDAPVRYRGVEIGRVRRIELASDDIERVQRSAEAFERMSNEMAGAGASAARTLEATRGDVRQFAAEALPEVRQLIAEARDLTNSLRQVADQVEQNPSVLLYGKPTKKRGPGE